VISISVIICTHDPRPDYLRRVLDALKTQTLPKEQWELLLIDNGSKESLSSSWDLSWHPYARHIREDDLGLTPARLRGLTEADGTLLVFIDDDNVPAPTYLERAAAIHASNSHITVFGAGTLEPEFEKEPALVVLPRLSMLGLRVVSRPTWSNNVADYFCTPWGAGLCVPRPIATLYSQCVRELLTSEVLDRRGEHLFCGGDDLFSWLCAGSNTGFGIFPELQITHLISAGRVRQGYLVRLVRDHTFSHAVLRYMVNGTKPCRATAFGPLRIIAHGLKNGWFSMCCQWAESRGTADAIQFISVRRLKPLNILALDMNTESTPLMRDTATRSIPHIKPVLEKAARRM
jgi:Glycosyl transferase family 2